MTTNRWIPVLALALTAVWPAAARQPRTAITASEIAAAISTAGINVSARQVTLLADVSSASASPALQVQSMEPWGERRMRVRLSCASQQECLPFFVAVRLDAHDAQQDAASSSLVSSGQTGAAPQAKSGSGSFAVRAGAPATLLLEGGHVHIQLAVVCLENGAPGQTIRVASRDHKQTYVAKVIDGTILRASL